MIDSYIARRRGKATANERQRRIDWKRIEQRTNRHSVGCHESGAGDPKVSLKESNIDHVVRTELR
jgi:hypothetical protein